MCRHQESSALIFKGNTNAFLRCGSNPCGVNTCDEQDMVSRYGRTTYRVLRRGVVGRCGRGGGARGMEDRDPFGTPLTKNVIFDS